MIDAKRVFLPAAAGALAALGLQGCNILGGNVPPDILKRCLTVASGERSTFSKWPMAALVEAVSAKPDAKVTWRRKGAGSYHLDVRRTDLGGKANSMLLAFIDDEDEPNHDNCGPGAIRAIGIAVNGEEQNEIFLQQVVLGLADAGARRLALPQPPTNVAIRTMDDLERSAQAEAASRNDDQAEVDADQEHYAQRASIAAGKSLSLRDRAGNGRCCWTVQRLIDQFAHGGATSQLDTSDDGRIWLTIDDPRGQLRGWKTIEFEMLPSPAAGDVIINKIKIEGDLVVAALNASGETPDEILMGWLPSD